MRIKLQQKIMIIALITTMVALGVSGLISRNIAREKLVAEIETSVMNSARTVAQMEDVIEGLKDRDPRRVQDQVSRVLLSSDNIEFIVVTDMEGRRYSHPNPEEIGRYFEGGDETRVLETGEEYTSEAQGTLGYSIRGFTPIHNENQERIGMVAVGILSENVQNITGELNYGTVVSIVFGGLIGLVGAFVLSKNIKRSLMGLEPVEITTLYQKYQGLLDTVSEGIISTDDQGRINYTNQAGYDILQLENPNIDGESIEALSPGNPISRTLQGKKSEENITCFFQGREIIMSTRLIEYNGKILGAIGSFRDKNDFTLLAEELTGARILTDSLRATTHEFSNKLQAILGLIQLGNIEEARDYLLETQVNNESLLQTLSKNIRNVKLQGLLLGKIHRCQEEGIRLFIDEDTFVMDPEKSLGDHQCVMTIVGNLVDNALEALNNKEVNGAEEEKSIRLLIQESRNNIRIEVEDNGPGIAHEKATKIFDKGYSAKGKGRGFGLYIVKKCVDSRQGSVKINTSEGEGATFYINLPKDDIGTD